MRDSLSHSTPTRPLILVLGMHRSGTSATTAVLGKLGLAMPNTPMTPQEENPTGYWESARLCDVHDEMLREAGSRWDDWTALRLADKPARTGEILTVLAEEFDLSRVSTVKDPRICRMVPFWLEALATGGFSPRIVIPYRNPLEVAASLVKRGNGMTTEQGLLLWLRHVLDAEAETRDQRRVFLRYDRLIEDWPGTMARVGRVLELEWPVAPAEAAAEIDAFLDKRLRRQMVAEPELRLLHPWLIDTFDALDILSDESRDPAEAMHTLDRIRHAFNAMCAARRDEMPFLIRAPASSVPPDATFTPQNG